MCVGLLLGAVLGVAGTSGEQEVQARNVNKPVKQNNAEHRQPLKTAFIRQGDLWVKIGEEEQQLTHEGKASSPKWSRDGEWIAYQTEDMLWAYGFKHKHSYPIDAKGVDYQWSPTENLLAYRKGHRDGEIPELWVVDIRDGVPHGQSKLSSGIDGYTWRPDGQGFVGATFAQPIEGEGFSQPALFKIYWDAQLREVVKAKLFTLPHEVKSGKGSVWSIGVSHFRWSPDGKWLSFIVSPTASWSMDSNVLCALSEDGQTFLPLDEMLVQQQDWVQWAPAKNWLGYIGGGGRFVLSTSPKDMKIQEMPTANLKAAHDLTPKGMKETGFTWQDDRTLTVSRMPIYQWNNDPMKRPLPALYQINLRHPDRQKQITHPVKHSGDFDPEYLPTAKKLSWVHYTRKPSADLWLSEPDGSNARLYIKGIGKPSLVEWEEWDDALSVYDPHNRPNSE
ncbi:MAG TPA: TolB domain-containing protein [Bacilli bacterium]|nr:TolB domain-containing protein [Bacilli bacterium]